jgi:hypothetical protein
VPTSWKVGKKTLKKQKRYSQYCIEDALPAACLMPVLLVVCEVLVFSFVKLSLKRSN